MTQWVGQRPPKNSRSRRVKVVSPASRNLEVQVLSEGCPTPDFNVKASSVGNNGFQLASSLDNSTPKYRRPPDDISSPFGLSESEESGAGENKIKEKGVNGSDFAMAADKDGASMLQMRKNKLPTDESGDSVQRQGRSGRNISLTRPGLPSGREKSENLPILKPVQDMRPNDKSKTYVDFNFRSSSPFFLPFAKTVITPFCWMQQIWAPSFEKAERTQGFGSCREATEYWFF